MKTIRLMGNLGNQMFQYALYLSFLNKGLEARIDDIGHYNADWAKKINLKPRLKSTFSLDYKDMGLFNKFYRKCFSTLSKKYHYKPKEMGIEDDDLYNPNVFNEGSAYLSGYWQSEKYFEDEKVQAQLRKDFQLPESHIYPEEYKKYEQQINANNSVSIHIRRTDYLYPAHFKNLRKYLYRFVL